MKMHEQFEERRRMGDVINILFVSLLQKTNQFHVAQHASFKVLGPVTFSSQGAALLLVSTKDLWEGLIFRARAE